MHELSPVLTPFPWGIFYAFVAGLVALIVWSIVIKGYALWHAARSGQTKWFIALLIINTLGILEIVYLVWFREKAPSISAISAVSSGTQA